MAGYVIVVENVINKAVMDEYQERIGPAATARGGNYVVRGAPAEVVEGDLSPDRLVILEFESLDKAREWVNSPEFAELRELRANSSNHRIFLAESA